jgi:predicted RNase H-like HicB family nuclease
MGAHVNGYAVVIERADDGYGAWSPELPGCVALGDTPEQAATEMREAIRLHVELLRERGEPVPQADRRAGRPDGGRLTRAARRIVPGSFAGPIHRP